MYPFLIKDGVAIRKHLIAKKIYIPCIWPNVLKEVTSNTWEYKLAADVLPLPIDQRYDEDDMRYIIRTIGEILYEHTSL